jgi:hypothetical protein
MSNSVHVYPVKQDSPLEHITEGAQCWCEPEACIVCPECIHLDKSPADCWRCAGRGIVAPSYGDDGPHIIVHNDR